ncbi:MAG: hypothetical protein JSS66_19005 [Armatimonadetes bacterium]|nr:hypothetical protein [Armatimonadota bacterium]
MKRLALLLALAASPAFAQDAPRQPDMQAAASELQQQVMLLSTRAATCASDLALARRDLEAAKKVPADPRPVN